jgi:hypothetical protein
MDVNLSNASSFSTYDSYYRRIIFSPTLISHTGLFEITVNITGYHNFTEYRFKLNVTVPVLEFANNIQDPVIAPFN